MSAKKAVTCLRSPLADATSSGWAGTAPVTAVFGGQGGDRLQEPQPITERQSQFPEMLVSEFRQHVGLDRVPAKDLFELLQPEASQPRRDVHLLLRPAFVLVVS